MSLLLLFPQPAASGATAAISGTLDGSTETDIVNGGKTIIITLTGDTWVAAGATFNAQRANIIAGLDAATSPTNGWNNTVRDGSLQVTDVVRTSDTVVTITVPATASYDIASAETITVTVPASALVTSGSPVVGSPTISIAAVSTRKAGGRVKKKRRYVVEVDGQYFDVNNIAEGEAILAQIRELAEESAERDVVTDVTPKPPKVKIRTAAGRPTTSQVLTRAVTRTQKAINRAYIEAARRRKIDRDISELLQRKIREEDEEEALIALLL